MYVDIQYVMNHFPEAYAQLLSGTWEDNETGAAIVDHDQLERWLVDTEFKVNKDKLQLLLPEEGWLTWNADEGDWDYPSS